MKNYNYYGYSTNLFNFKYNPEDYKPSKYYIAYGSNMSLSRLKSRCPNSEFIGIGVIEGYKLIFRKSASGFFASIDKVDYKKKKKRKSLWSVPVAIFKISKSDELSLDRFEGCPRWYKKIELDVKDDKGDKITGICYVLPETSKIGVPNSEYYQIILKAYESFGIDSKILEKAFLVSYKKSEESGSKKSGKKKNANNIIKTNNISSGFRQLTLFPSTLNISNSIHSHVRVESKSYSDRIFSLNPENFLREFQRELDVRMDVSGLVFELTRDNLYILDSESGETYFMIYPPVGNTFYIENIMDNDFMDYSSIDDAVFDISSYFSAI